MRRRLLLAAAVALPAALGPSGVAAAANADIQAVDGVAANNFVNAWAPASVSIQAGDTVTWRFDNAQLPHNVASSGGNWQTPLDSPLGVKQPPVSQQFSQPGQYEFVCEVHSEMRGTVLVAAPGAPPPPPPPPPMETGPDPFPNPTTAPDVFERSDDERPRVLGLQASGVRRGARIRFRLTEDARVTVRVKRGRRTIRATSVSLARGTHRLTMSGRQLVAGRYQIEISARDNAGNRSRLTSDRVRIR